MIGFLFKYRYILIIILLLSLNIFLYDKYSDEVVNHKLSISNKDKEYLNMENTYLVTIAKHQSDSLQRYNSVNNKLADMQRSYDDQVHKIRIIGESVDASSNRLSERIEELSSESNDDEVSDSDPTTTKRLRAVSRVATEAVRESGQMVENLEQCRLSVITLQDGWRALGVEYSDKPIVGDSNK